MKLTIQVLISVKVNIPYKKFATNLPSFTDILFKIFHQACIHVAVGIWIIWLYESTVRNLFPFVFEVVNFLPKGNYWVVEANFIEHLGSCTLWHIRKCLHQDEASSISWCKNHKPNIILFLFMKLNNLTLKGRGLS